MLTIDTILLFSLIIPFIMGYRISPFGTQYWLFGIIFSEMLLYVLADIYVLSKLKYEMVKNLLLWLLLFTIIGSSFAATIYHRHITHPVYQIHDIILQQEAAIRYFLDGKNPYAESYFGTFLEQWNYSEKEINPALYHFVMEPFYLLFSLPFYFLSNRTIGYFDGRIPLFSLFFLLVALAFILVKNGEQKRLFVILLAFHPSMLPYTLEGRSDIFMYAFMFLSFYLLHKKKYTLSSLPLALSFAVKQSAWPLFPFYFYYLIIKTRNIRKIGLSLLMFFSVFLVVILPFFLWNQKAFWDSTIGYLNGSVSNSYPVSGYGIGSVLIELGIIRDKFSYYPFILWQIIIGIPVILILFKYMKKQKNIQSMILSYGIFLLIYWYFSRYFNNSHIAFISLIFISVYFWPKDTHT